MKRKPYVIAVAGGSGSGKTYLAENLVAKLADRQPLLLSQDYYYRDRSDLTLAQRQTINYDHPEAIDFSLLIAHLQELARGQAIAHPLYNFAEHNRRPETVTVSPSELIVLDGILLLAVTELRPLLDLKIFVETATDLCFIRRLERDTRTRGRSVQSVIDQYLATVRPMYLTFVYPSRVHADLLVSGEEDISQTMEKVIAQLSS
jgi:uridine kinase